MNCVICLTELVPSNDSLEHIIPASVGGKLKKRGVLCKSCNNTAGEDWDSDLARQLNFFSVTFDVDRERGPAPPEKVRTSTGEELLLHPGKPMTQVRPVFKSTQLPGRIAYEIQARSMDEAKAIVKKLARKHPDLDVEAVLASAQISNELLAICLDKAISHTAEWYYNDLGSNYEELKDFKTAVANYDTAYYLFKEPLMLYNCGRIAETQLKNKAMARKYYTLYLRTAHPLSAEEKKAYNYVRLHYGSKK